ncbi:MAG: NADH-quinone oxidoreductase subunit NuoF [Clostridiales bacterium]|nr:NADH-quinone oxidoreductase subunit NuoF [Clostridiales bacterium]
MKTLQELQEIRDRLRSTIEERKEGATVTPGNPKKYILVCGGTGCTSGNSKIIRENFVAQIKERGLEDEVKVIFTGCFGLCSKGPIAVVYPDGSFYTHVQPDDVAEIMEQHIVGGKPVERLLHAEKDAHGQLKSINDTDFYRSQRRVVLRNCGVIDPENIDEYLATDGYKAYEKAVTTMTQQQVIDEVKRSGLRGRGGAGFSTGMKWQFTHDAPGDVKYVACNADEGDPGAFMDRSLLEGDPHAVIEAMMIAGYAVGAEHGVIYVRAEYPIAVNRLEVAIAQAREYGILGDNVMGLGKKFDLELRLGAGAFVCGEETALLNSAEGKRGEPRQRPPFPAVKGLFGKPTLINNVETYGNITQIILNGADWFSSVGTEKSKGTKVFALGGKLENVGLVEIPMGTTLRTIVEDIGGGCPGGKKFKAAQTGGPSGGCIPLSKIDTEIDYDNLMAIGSMMGSGGLIVMDEDNCMVDIAKFFLEFTVDESCGKCTPCRIGNKRLLEMLDKVTRGEATLEDLDKMEELCHYIKDNSLCGLGQTAPNPVLSTLHYFRDEYEAHCQGKCPAGVCKALLSYKIDKDKCIGCGKCARGCPVTAIAKTDYTAPGHKLPSYEIAASKCIKCGACEGQCPTKAISK